MARDKVRCAECRGLFVGVLDPGMEELRPRCHGPLGRRCPGGAPLAARSRKRSAVAMSPEQAGELRRREASAHMRRADASIHALADSMTDTQLGPVANQLAEILDHVGAVREKLEALAS